MLKEIRILALGAALFLGACGSSGGSDGAASAQTVAANDGHSSFCQEDIDQWQSCKGHFPVFVDASALSDDEDRRFVQSTVEADMNDPNRDGWMEIGWRYWGGNLSCRKAGEQKPHLSVSMAGGEFPSGGGGYDGDHGASTFVSQKIIDTSNFEVEFEAEGMFPMRSFRVRVKAIISNPPPAAGPIQTTWYSAKTGAKLATWDFGGQNALTESCEFTAIGESNGSKG